VALNEVNTPGHRRADPISLADGVTVYGGITYGFHAPSLDRPARHVRLQGGVRERPSGRLPIEEKTMRLFRHLWCDETGSASPMWAFIATILVLGAITGVVASRQAGLSAHDDPPMVQSR
jgi:hypothetical protein